MARIDIHNTNEWLSVARRSSYRVRVLCKELNVCQRQVQRYTHDAFGQSPQQWLAEQRLIDALEILKKYRSVKIASCELGFKWSSHFCREFKKYYGMSPRAFMIGTAREMQKAACVARGQGSLKI
jgi:AraC-like DNA-binding protein